MARISNGVAELVQGCKTICVVRQRHTKASKTRPRTWSSTFASWISLFWEVSVRGVSRQRSRGKRNLDFHVLLILLHLESKATRRGTVESVRDLGGILAPAGAYRGWTCPEENSYGLRKVFAISVETTQATLVQTPKAAVLQHEVRKAYNTSAEGRNPRRNNQAPLIIEITAYDCD